MTLTFVRNQQIICYLWFFPRWYLASFLRGFICIVFLFFLSYYMLWICWFLPSVNIVNLGTKWTKWTKCSQNTGIATWGGVFPLPEHFWRNAFNPSLPPQWWAITPKLIIWHCQHFGNIWSSNSYLLVDNFFFGKQGTNMLMIKAKTILINVTNILINVTNTLMVVWLILPGVIFDWRDRGWAPLGNFGSCLGWWSGRKTETKQNATNEINEIWYWTDQKCLFLQFFYLSFASFFSPPPKYSTGWES